jgi:O-antigen/teichoic acid export membrane protein
MMVILAHLLAPSDFGLAGLVLVFTVLFQMLADVGFTASLVQFEGLSEGDRSTAFWTGLGVAVVCFGVAVLVAPYVADFYHEPRVRWMFVAVASGLVLGALSNTQAALLTRRMDFRRIEIRGMMATVVSAAVGITAAALHAGAWSLIAAAVAGTAASTIAIWIVSPWKPHLVFSFRSLRRMASFSTGIFFTRFTYYADQNTDNLLVGKFLGTAALGIYTIGYSVILVPFERIVEPVASVIIPAFATLQNDLEGTRKLWLRGQRLIAAVMFPAVAGVIIVAPDFVPAVLGSRWAPAVIIIQILAWVALIQSPSVLNAGLYRSRYRVDLLIRLGFLAAALDIAAFAIGLHWGVRGVATGYALTNTLVITPVGLFFACRIIGVSFRQLTTEIRGVAEATVVMSLLLVGLRRILEVEHVGTGLRLTILIAVGAAIYLLMCRWRERELFSELSIRRFAASATV